MAHSKTVVVVGAGMMGAAMTRPIVDNGHRARLCGTPLDADIIREAKATGRHATLRLDLPQGVESYFVEEMGEALRGADAVICGVSSFGVDWFCREVMPLLPDGMPVLSVTKGLQDEPDGSFVAFPDMYHRASGGRCPVCAVGGPVISFELCRRRQTNIAFCGRDEGALAFLRELLLTDYYHIMTTPDVMGVECAVALKNAYALAVCLAVGLYEAHPEEVGGTAFNPQAALFTQSVLEAHRLIALAGGGTEFAALCAGDLYVTIYGGRTRRLGILLGQGVPPDEALRRLSDVTLESVAIAGRVARALRALCAAGKADARDFPLILHAEALLRGEREPALPWDSFGFRR